MWYEEKSRRVTATPRASTSNASAHQSASGGDDGKSEPFSMDEWKQWMQISIGDNDASDGSLSDELKIGTDEVVLM